MVETGLTLTIVFLICFYLNKKNLLSGWVFFFYVGIMTLCSLCAPSFLAAYDITVDVFMTFLLAVLLCLGFLPWIKFDKFLLKNKSAVIIVNPKYINRIKIISTVLIISALYSIIYLLPFAIISFALGADTVRHIIQSDNLLPKNIYTTLAVGLAGLNIFCILFFYICCLDQRLYSYRKWLIIGSLSNVVAAFTFAGRDQLITILTFYIVWGIIFSYFVNNRVKRYISKIAKMIIIFISIFLISFTLSRFAKDDSNTDSLFSGTLGYIAQQPYIFNTTIEKTKQFYGFERRFPLVNRIIGGKRIEFNATEAYQWQFPTMYGNFYAMGGWPILIIMSCIFIGYYSLTMKYLIARKRLFGAMVLFCVYLYIEITGFFYIKAGGSILVNLFYLILSILPLKLGNYIYFSNIRISSISSEKTTILKHKIIE